MRLLYLYPLLGTVEIPIRIYSARNSATSPNLFSQKVGSFMYLNMTVLENFKTKTDFILYSYRFAHFLPVKGQTGRPVFYTKTTDKWYRFTGAIHFFLYCWVSEVRSENCIEFQMRINLLKATVLLIMQLKI